MRHKSIGMGKDCSDHSCTDDSVAKIKKGSPSAATLKNRFWGGMRKRGPMGDEGEGDACENRFHQPFTLKYNVETERARVKGRASRLTEEGKGKHEEQQTSVGDTDHNNRKKENLLSPYTKGIPSFNVERRSGNVNRTKTEPAKRGVVSFPKARTNYRSLLKTGRDNCLSPDGEGLWPAHRDRTLAMAGRCHFTQLLVLFLRSETEKKHGTSKRYAPQEEVTVVGEKQRRHTQHTK
jgi:hypothetical protein